VSGFGHDYPADRAWQALFSHAAYNSFPRHARSLDVGCALDTGELRSLGEAVEFFQLVEMVEGQLYRLDLERMLEGPARDLDTARAVALARFLASAHELKHDDPAIYQRRIRELVGHGECLMGILDSYPDAYSFLPEALRESLERAAVGWRWRLRDRTHRLARTHGDFHPWNILFREGTDFSVLDRARGEWGDPADDVACLTMNYLFFSLQRHLRLQGPLEALFRRFWDRYLERSGDEGVLEVAAPFLAFRGLVMASPVWYPNLPAEVRRRLFTFMESVLEAARFDPALVNDYCGG
jgi:aminoglycoside phosphotransferase (APT) family kinase protein